jgi:glycosidase
MTANKLKIFTLIAIAAILSGCKLFRKESAKAVPYPEWVKSSVIYEINTGQYSHEGTFNALKADLPRIRELGIDILCLMPVNTVGEKNRKFEKGDKTNPVSYYPARDYKMVNSEFGTSEEFKSLVSLAHEMGFKVIIDWIANYTSRDNNWINEHPGWYKKDKNGDIASPHNQKDCAQLDYNNRELRKEMTGSMKFWIKNFDIDGFRCEIAGLVPDDFWEATRSELQEIKPLFMIAGNEDKPGLVRMAFDSDYGLEMNHLMAAVTQKKQPASSILELQVKIDSVLPQRGFRLNFITNHYEDSWNGTPKEKFGDGEKSCAVLTYTLPGMPLIYNGQETAMTNRLQLLSKDTPESGDTRIIKFYKILNGLKHRNPAIWTPPNGGKFLPLTNTAPEKIVSFLRSAGNSRVMVLVNMSQDSITALITSTIADGKYVNTFNGNKINFSADNRECYFEPWEFIIMEGE